MWMQLGLGPRETVRLRISFTLRGVRRWYLAGLITPCVSLGGSSPSPATRRLFVLFLIFIIKEKYKMARKEKHYHFIYKTTDTRNGNFYIGMHSTDNLNDGYVGSGLRLKKLISKHGKEIFKMEILEFLPDRESLKKREAEIVNSDLLKEEKCMNLREGGEGGGGFWNDEHMNKCQSAGGKKVRQILANRHCEKYKTDLDYKEKWLNSYHNAMKDKENGFKNKKHKDESKIKISESCVNKHVGELNSQFGTCWITNGIVNKKIKKSERLPVEWNYGRVV